MTSTARLKRTLERWCVRELQRTDGKAHDFSPSMTYLWAMNSKGEFYATAEVYCEARSTKPLCDDPLDDFGVAFRELPQIEQELIIMGHFCRKPEWKVFLHEKGIKSKLADKYLQIAWGHLWVECKRREVI